MAQDRMESGGQKPKPAGIGRAPNIGSTLSSASKVLEKVRVVHGANEGYFDLSGQTVGQTKKALRDVFNIPTEAEASIGGKQVGDDFILEAGQSLEFVKEAGVKGLPDHLKYFYRCHLDQVVAIEQQCFSHPWTAEDFVRVFRPRKNMGFVYELKGKVVGYVFYELIESNIRILNIAVDPKHQRKGYGKELINELKRKLKRQNRVTITAEVRETNLDAQLFLKDSGLKGIQVLRNHYDEMPEDAYLMRFSLVEEAEACWSPKNRISEYVNEL